MSFKKASLITGQYFSVIHREMESERVWFSETFNRDLAVIDKEFELLDVAIANPWPSRLLPEIRYVYMRAVDSLLSALVLVERTLYPDCLNCIRIAIEALCTAEFLLENPSKIDDYRSNTRSSP